MWASLTYTVGHKKQSQIRWKVTKRHNTCINTACTPIHTHTHTHPCTHTYKHMHTNEHIPTHTHMHITTHTPTHTSMHTPTHTHMHTPTHTHTRAYTVSYTQTTMKAAKALKRKRTAVNRAGKAGQRIKLSPTYKIHK